MSSLGHTNNRVRSPELSEPPQNSLSPVFETVLSETVFDPSLKESGLDFSGVDKRVVSKRVVLADVPPERKPERGHIRMFPRNEKPERGYVRMLPRNENRNEGTFAETTLLRNRPFISQWTLKGP